MHHLLNTPFLLAMLAIPSFLSGWIISLILPSITGWLTGQLSAIFKRGSAWEATVSPLIGGALHLIGAFVVATVLVKAGVGIDTQTLSCLNDPAAKQTIGCIDAQSQSAIIQYLVQLITQLIGHNSATAHAAWKAAKLASRPVPPR